MMSNKKLRKSFVALLLFCAAAISLMQGGCGVDTVTPPSSSTTVSGVAAAGKAIRGTVTLKDSSRPSRIRTTVTNADGSYNFSVNGLTPPFILMVKWEDDNATTLRLHSLSKQHGRANINPLSDVVLAGATGASDPTTVFDSNDPVAIEAAAAKLMAAMEALRTVLAPMFQLYNIDKDPIEDDFTADHTGLDALFDDVRIYAASGTIIVRNKRTNGLIFSAPINDMSSGTFYENNLPVQPGTLNGPALYANNCAGCHGVLASSGKMGATAAEIQAAIAANAGGMGSLSGLSALEIQTIATALAVTTTPPTPIDGAALYAGKCSSCHGALATSSMQGSTAAAIQSAINNNRGGMGSLSTLTADQVAAIATALATTTPPQPTACTSFTYSAWGACQSNNTQTRTQLTASPAGCTGGTPVLSQACTYVPPVTACTSFTYSAWGTCQSNSTQTRTQLTASPAGCTGGTPVLSQA
jgi:mono/diheme cytochrome c family protein